VLSNLLNIRYSHVVVTLPAWLRGLAQRNGQMLHNLMFRSLKHVVLDWFGEKHGIEPGLVMVLHTAGSDLKYHLHMHCIASFGGADLKTREIKALKGNFLVNHKFLRSRFRHVFQGGLIARYDSGDLQVAENFPPRQVLPISSPRLMLSPSALS